MLDNMLLLELQEYIKFHLMPNPPCECKACENVYSREIQSMELEDFIKVNRKETFSQVLFRFIDKKGVSDTDIYKRAGIDRRHFSKIRSNPNYHPEKKTAIALSIALELNEDDMDELLGAAGYSLSNGDMFDLVIRFFVERNIYVLEDINEALVYFSLKPLAGVLE